MFKGWCDIKAVYLAERMVIDSENRVGKIHSFLDSDGEETDDVSEAHQAIVRWDDTGFWTPVTLIKSDFTAKLN